MPNLAGFSSRLLSAAVVATCAAWPLLAAEPAPVQQQQPSEPISASLLQRTKVVAPEYPQIAVEHGVEAVVNLQFTVLPDGSTADIEVAHDEPTGQFEESATRAFFEESAIRALQQWRYEPVVRNGKPVAQRAEIRIKFQI